MNKKAIRIIIGLMAVASIGIIILQFTLIRSAVSMKEAEFEQDVFDALNAVAEQLEEQERYNQLDRVSGFSLQHQRENIVIGSYKKDFGEFNDSPITASGSSLLTAINNGVNPFLNPLSVGSDAPIELRLPDLQQLDNFIRQELFDRGIKIDYSYGVFSIPDNTFVVRDGYYTAKDDSPKSFLPGVKNLHTSDYQVSLFSRTGKPPGMLMIFFPNITGFVWSKVWLNILASILFTGIMMYCFIYTINVVFKQKKLSEMKTDFMNNMTHEFKTPIATISLAADSINSPMISGNPDKVQRFANIIKQENRRMNSQVEKVLQMASLDKEDFSLKLVGVNLHEVIRTAVQNIGLQVEKRDGKAYADLKAERALVEGDMTHISNIINNLLDNANKYSPDNPEISVHTRNVPNGVEVIIKDRGMGMSKEARKHIFDKFYRVHTGDLHDVKGFGLGLSYVKAMMTAHKGTIDVKSDLGKGSSFILFFPFYIKP